MDHKSVRLYRCLITHKFRTEIKQIFSSFRNFLGEYYFFSIKKEHENNSKYLEKEDRFGFSFQRGRNTAEKVAYGGNWNLCVTDDGPREGRDIKSYE